LLLREVGSATRQLTERALQAAGVRYQAGLVLEHTEAIKRLGCGFGGDTARLGEGSSLNYGHLATSRMAATTVRSPAIGRLAKPP
jgi:hypothetical protein